jgi:hypothetical protein
MAIADRMATTMTTIMSSIRVNPRVLHFMAFSRKGADELSDIAFSGGQMAKPCPPDIALSRARYWETENPRQRSWRDQAAGGRRQAAGGRRQAAGGRRQAAGGRRQAAGSVLDIFKMSGFLRFDLSPILLLLGVSMYEPAV